MFACSIVIATYNRGEKLERTLRSLAGQTMPVSKWEAVVVDNNSTDDTPEVFARFAAAHPSLNLKMVAQSKQGLSHARNKGIEESVAPLIAIIDDDEEVNAEFVATYVDFFARHPEALMAGGRVVPSYEGKRPEWMSCFTERPIAGTLDKGRHEKPFGRGYPPGGNMAVRRSAFELYGMFDPSLGRTGTGQIGGEEKELAGRIVSGSRAAGTGFPVWWVPGAVIYHIIPPQKLTLKHFRRLARGVGKSERIRTTAISSVAYAFALVKEALKWVVTIVLSLWFVFAQQPLKARYLLIMRARITSGLLS